MSSAVYPLGMNSMPASGYTHQSTYYNKQYIPWKGTGVNSFPVGTAPGHIRPLTNNDPGNNFPTGFGLYALRATANPQGGSKRSLRVWRRS